MKKVYELQKRIDIIKEQIETLESQKLDIEFLAMAKKRGIPHDQEKAKAIVREYQVTLRSTTINLFNFGNEVDKIKGTFKEEYKNNILIKDYLRDNLNNVSVGGTTINYIYTSN